MALTATISSTGGVRSPFSRRSGLNVSQKISPSATIAAIEIANKRPTNPGAASRSFARAS
jgi:hypothetical protein